MRFTMYETKPYNYSLFNILSIIQWQQFIAIEIMLLVRTHFANENRKLPERLIQAQE